MAVPPISIIPLRGAASDDQSAQDERNELLDQVRDVIRRKNYSLRTEQAYKPGIGVKSPLD